MTELKSRFRQLTSSFCVSFVESGERADKCIAITEEIAIGFSKWKWENGWYCHTYTKGFMIYFKNSQWDGKPKTDSELFKDYMESLNP